MRTTLTLDDDLAAALKQRARATGLSFKEVVNEALRRGLAIGEAPEGASDRFRVVARAHGFRTGVDPRRLNQLVDDLEVADFRQGLARDLESEPDKASRVHDNGEPESES